MPRWVHPRAKQQTELCVMQSPPFLGSWLPNKLLAQRLGFGALHVGFEPAQPEQTGTGARVAPDRDAPLVRRRSTS